MRREEYKIGSVLYPNRHHAILISPVSVAVLAKAVTQTIPAQFFVAAAEHESNFAVNEIDTESDGKKTYGLVQLDDEEYASVPGAGPLRLEPWNDIRTFALNTSRRADRIHGWTQGNLARPEDLWAYLGLYHNEGGGACEKTIKAHGADWLEYKRRNLVHALTPEGAHDLDRARRISAYGDAMISGGSRWREVVEAGIA